MKSSRRLAAGVAGGLGLLSLLVLSAAGPAWADAPSKTGWWNAMSAGGAALPVPTTGADDLHVSQGPNGPAAYAALAYDVLGQTVSAATLELKVVANSAVGTLDLMACPTKDTSWKAGGDQAMDAGPQYDCSKGVVGAATDDLATVTFFLDAPPLGSVGYSVAVAPSPDALPFSVDFVKPDASTLTLQVEAAEVAPAPAAPPAAAPPAVGAPVTAPLGPVTAPVAPVVPQQAPAVAPVVPAPQAAAAPVPITQAATTTPVSNRDRYAAGTMLALISGLLVWAFQQPAPTPRLIGGMARKAAPGVAVPVDVRPRGIGRFAALRTTPARPLL
jgi:hypothetical protein